MLFFFFKQKTAYEMRISDWSSDVCSSDLLSTRRNSRLAQRRLGDRAARFRRQRQVAVGSENCREALADRGRKGCHPAAREIDVEPKAFHGRGKEALLGVVHVLKEAQALLIEAEELRGDAQRVALSQLAPIGQVDVAGEGAAASGGAVGRAEAKMVEEQVGRLIEGQIGRAHV